LRAVDAHAHLHDPRLRGDLDEIVARAGAAGVERILSCGEDVPTSDATLAIARRHSSVRVAVGVHPHRASTWSDETAMRLREMARDERVVAIGEIGIDLSGRSAPRAAQVVAFEAQLRLARELDLPVVVHVRDGGELAREVIDRVRGTFGMLHCYSEGPDEVMAWLGREFFLSFAGTVTYPKNEPLRRAAAVPPSTALLVETDAPYLPPEGRRGQRNEPAFVVDTLAAVARTRGVAPEELGATVAGNAANLFGARWGTT
jgi:TatD DNase family protein